MQERKSITQRRKEREKLMRRLHILDCAEEIMIRKGLNGLSMDAVAKEAELAKGTLYLYYKSKEDILGHLTIRAREELLKVFHIHMGKANSPLEEIEAVFHANYEFYHTQRLYSDLVSFYEVNNELEETDELLQSSNNIMSLIVTIIGRAKAQGLVKSHIDPAELSLMMWGMCVGILQLMTVKKDMIEHYTQIDLEKFYLNFVRVAIEGIKA